LNPRVWSCYRAGSILIVVLWTVFFLGLLSVAVGAYVGAHVELARRVGDRLYAGYAARAGVETSLAVMRMDTNAWDAMSEPWADNPKIFRDVSCGEGSYSVYYLFKKADGSMATNYGIRDEQARIDLNRLDASRMGLLASLLQTAGGVTAREANQLVESIQAARTVADRDKPQVSDGGAGWGSPVLSAGPFLSVYELLWVKGMSPSVFERLRDHVTVNGSNRININTADETVLRALFSQGDSAKWEVGAVDRLVRKILNFRESGGTFKNLRNLAEAFSDGGGLSADEQVQLNGASRFVTVGSDHFRGQVKGEHKGRASGAQSVTFVWDRKQNRIEYWYED
jgi:type II secretory pathway component PulK